MAIEDAKRFIDQYHTNSELRSKFSAMTLRDGPVEAVALGQANGFSFSEEDLLEALAQSENKATLDMQALPDDYVPPES